MVVRGRAGVKPPDAAAPTSPSGMLCRRLAVEGCPMSLRTTTLSLFALVAALSLAAALPKATTLRASVNSGGGGADGHSTEVRLSGNGRYVAFASAATDLVEGDDEGKADVFVRDLAQGETRRLSVGPDGEGADATCFGVALSANGRWVAFASAATNLVPGVTGLQVYLVERATGAIETASVDGAGVPVGGRQPSLSSSGRFVAFASTSDALVEGDDNGNYDVFRLDRSTGTVTCCSLGLDGTTADGLNWLPALSGNGRWVAFTSTAGDLVAGDANGVEDVYLHDVKTGETQRVSVGPLGADANDDSTRASISRTGRHVLFDSTASNLVEDDSGDIRDVFLFDAKAGLMTLVSRNAAGLPNMEAGAEGFGAALSASGRVAAWKAQFEVIDGDENQLSDIHVTDFNTGVTTLVSLGPAGEAADNDSSAPVISANGKVAAWVSLAGNLVADDGDANYDVFVRRL
jgi:dipeptidyl aminopeptidase/acylaminoacyl peptidase